MCSALLAVRTGVELDWTAAQTAIDTLAPDILSRIGDEYGLDKAGLAETVEYVRQAIASETGECDRHSCGDWTLYVTGGLNPPTTQELLDDFRLLWDTGLAELIGFSRP
jgi:hypothetical protein